MRDFLESGMRILGLAICLFTAHTFLSIPDTVAWYWIFVAAIPTIFVFNFGIWLYLGRKIPYSEI